MKTRFFSLAIALVAAVAAMAMSPLQAFVADTDGPVTNIRSKPNGPIVMTLPTTSCYIVNLDGAKNGWWQISWVVDCFEDEPIELKGSPTGKYWIHYSVLGLNTRNYGHQRWCLRKSPSSNSRAVYWFAQERQFKPMDISRDGDWVKVKTDDLRTTGWIEIWNLCDNPLTTCP